MAYGHTATKATDWTHLNWADCTVLRREGPAIQVKHPLLKRARWFSRSRSGHYYSRYTGRDWSMDREAIGYVLVGEGELLAGAKTDLS